MRQTIQLEIGAVLLSTVKLRFTLSFDRYRVSFIISFFFFETQGVFDGIWVEEFHSKSVGNFLTLFVKFFLGLFALIGFNNEVLKKLDQE